MLHGSFDYMQSDVDCESSEDGGLSDGHGGARVSSVGSFSVLMLPLLLRQTTLRLFPKNKKRKRKGRQELCGSGPTILAAAAAAAAAEGHIDEVKLISSDDDQKSRSFSWLLPLFVSAARCTHTHTHDRARRKPISKSDQSAISCISFQSALSLPAVPLAACAALPPYW